MTVVVLAMVGAVAVVVSAFSVVGFNNDYCVVSYSGCCACC